MSQPDIGTLRADCRSGDPDKQLPALLELIKIHAESSLPDIIPLLSSPDEEVRAEAARAVGYLGSGQASSLGPLLLPLLSDSNELVRDEAVEALGLVIYPPASAALKGILRNDPSWMVRASVAEALGSYLDATVLHELEQVLHDGQEEAEVQAYAARSLFQYPQTDRRKNSNFAPLPALPDMNNINTNIPKRSSDFALGRIADAAYLPTLDGLIAGSSKEPRVRAALLATGYRLGGQQYLDQLLGLLGRANESESWSLLNEVQDLVESSQRSRLVADSTRIRAALRTTALRWPLTAQHVQEIEGQLPPPLDD
jgi:HEAT repeat protein